MMWPKGNFLKRYAEYSKNTESPQAYHLWGAMSTIASAVRRRVFLDQGIYTLYPNMYVILVGPPGKVGKSTAIRLGRKILYAVEGIKFGPDSLTREELIREMAKAGVDSKESSLTIHSSELASLIEPSGLKMIEFLTDIYDGAHEWRYSTKHQGKDIIKAPMLNILAGTTPSWISTGFPEAAIGHGFTRRTVFVYASEPQQIVPFPITPDPQLITDLQEILSAISMLSGEFTLTPDAREAYEKIYRKIYNTVPSDYRIEGFHWMKKIHVLKVAMVLSLADGDSLEITADNIQIAWKIVSAVEAEMPKTFSAVGKYEHATDLERILNDIIASKGMSAVEIYRKNYAVGSPEEIARILQMLISMNRIDRKKTPEGTIFVPVEGAIVGSRGLLAVRPLQSEDE